MHTGSGSRGSHEIPAPKGPSSRYTNRGALIAENFKTPKDVCEACSHYKGSVHFDMGSFDPCVWGGGSAGEGGSPHMLPPGAALGPAVVY